MHIPSDSAEDYIRSLTDVTARRNARDYALMDTDEFKARFGPALDELERVMTDKLDEILTMIKKAPPAGIGPLTRAAMWVEETPPRRIIATVTTLGALALALFEALTK